MSSLVRSSGMDQLQTLPKRCNYMMSMMSDIPTTFPSSLTLLLTPLQLSMSYTDPSFLGTFSVKATAAPSRAEASLAGSTIPAFNQPWTVPESSRTITRSP